MIKVLHIFNRFIIGGSSYAVFYLIRYSSDDINSRLITGAIEKDETEANFLVHQLKEEPIHIPYLQRSINLFKDWQAYRQIRKVIKEFKPHVVHTHSAKPGVVGRLAAAHENVPVIIHTFHGHVFHSYFNKLKTKFFIRIEKWLATKTDAIIAISEQQKTDLAFNFKISNPEKIHIVPIGFDIKRFADWDNNKRNLFRKEFLLNSQTVAIGIIGRIVPIKNHKMFIDVIAKIKSRIPSPFKAFIIGDGELKAEIIQYAISKGLKISINNQNYEDANIIFTSWREDIESVMNGLDIITLTSLNEGTPVSLIEAQAAGKPLVATDAGGTRDCLAPFNKSFITDVNDVSAFANHLLNYFKNRESYQKEAEGIRNYVMEKYNYHRSVIETENLYRLLLTEKINERPPQGQEPHHYYKNFQKL